MTAAVRHQLPTLSEEDRTRANLYGLLGALLARSPDPYVLDILRKLNGDSSDLGRAFARLKAKAETATPPAIADEYQLLFIGVGRGELLPYGSYYLTGFLNEKPLARLRRAMAELGIARDPAVKEPEDHAGALMDMMAGLIDGRFGAPEDIDSQRRFFADHVGNWMPHFFRDLETAAAADFYRPVGEVGRIFMAIEAQAFEME